MMMMNSPKVNVVDQLEFKLASFEATIQRLNPLTKGILQANLNYKPINKR